MVLLTFNVTCFLDMERLVLDQKQHMTHFSVVLYRNTKASVSCQLGPSLEQLHTDLTNLVHESSSRDGLTADD